MFHSRAVRAVAAGLALSLASLAGACGQLIPGPIITINTPTLTPAQKYATEILANTRIDKSGRLVLTDLKDAAAGKPGSAGKMLNTALLRVLATLGQTHSFLIFALESGGTGHDTKKGMSPHYVGNAADIAVLDGHKLTGRDRYSMIAINELAPLLPPGSRFGEAYQQLYDAKGKPTTRKSCGPYKAALPKGITEFSDYCNHLHIDVPTGSS